MNGRLKEICARIRPCGVFADIGCDHGYVSQYVAAHSLAEKVYFTDVSAECLAKAEKLLAPFVAEGKAEGALGNGMRALPVRPDEALIAGMGGEEIVNILSASPFAADRLILQPMKNTDKVRRFLAENGWKTEEDVVFSSGGKFYDLLTAGRGEESLTEDELLFGKSNLALRPAAFTERLRAELSGIERYLTAARSESARAALEERKRKIEEILR